MNSNKLIIDLDTVYDTESLLEFVNQKTAFHKHTILESERYGVGYILRKVYFYPEKFPIRIFYPHGPSPYNELQSYIIDSNYGFYFFFTRRHLKNFKLHSSKVFAFCLEHPFLAFTRKRQLTQFKKAALFFLQHSTNFSDRLYDFNYLVEILKDNQLTEVVFCLHYIDIQKGLHKPLIEFGFKVVSAGNWENKFFAVNLIKLISSFSVVVTNGLGTHIYYSTLLNKRVIFLDLKEELLTVRDPNLRDLPFSLSDNFLEVERLFKSNSEDLKKKIDVSCRELGFKESKWFFIFSMLYLSLFTYYSKFYFQLLLRKFKGKS